jgi:hypothetical protein
MVSGVPFLTGEDDRRAEKRCLADRMGIAGRRWYSPGCGDEVARLELSRSVYEAWRSS